MSSSFLPTATTETNKINPGKCVICICQGYLFYQTAKTSELVAH